MLALTPEQLVVCSDFEAAVQGVIAEALRNHPETGLIADASGFEVFEDESADAESDRVPTYTVGRFHFAQERCAPLIVTFGLHPAETAFTLPSISGWVVGMQTWRMELRAGETMQSYLSRLARFLDDWFRGLVRVRIHMANGAAFRWEAWHQAHRVFRCRRICYNFFGRRTTREIPPLA